MMSNRARLVLFLLMIGLSGQSAWAGKILVGSSGPVDRPLAWTGPFLNSAHIGGTISFVAPDTAVTVEFLSRRSIPIDGILLDGPGGLDGPINEFDNRWYDIYLAEHPLLSSGFPVPNPEFAVLGPDEFYMNFPDSASVVGWTGVNWSSDSAADSMGTDGYPTSYTGSVRIGEAETGAKYSSLRIGNLLPGNLYRLSYWSDFDGWILGVDYFWDYPPLSEQEAAMNQLDHYNLWVRIYEDDGQSSLEFGELQQLSSSNSGCPLPTRDDSSRFSFKDNWLFVRGEADPLFPGTCVIDELKVWRREGVDLVQKANIPVPASATGQQFGASIAIDGDRLAIGSSFLDASNPAGGTVFVYELAGQNWTLAQEIQPPASLLQNRGGFGHSIVMQDGVMGVWAKAAQELLIYELNAGVWSYTESFSDFIGYLEAQGPDESLGEILQMYLGTDGMEFVVSSPEEYFLPEGLGAAKEIRKVADQWEVQTELNPMDGTSIRAWTADNFSHAMDASALRQVYGIPNNDEEGPAAGTVWVRHRDAIADPWIMSFLYPPRPVVDAKFGSAVAIENDILLVGAPGAISDAGVTGVCYRYILENGDWLLDGELLPTDVAAGDGFASSLSLDNGYAIISSPGKNNGAGGLYHFSVNDCDGSGHADGWEIENGFSQDVDNDGIPDDCPGANWAAKPAALFESFVATKSMSWGDFDNDGDDDIFLATASGEANRLLRNDQELGFTDITPLMLRKIFVDNYSAAWGDCDLDGNLDLFIAADGEDFLFMGIGDGTFSLTSVANFQTANSSRSAGWGDINRDGLLDLCVGHFFDGSTIYLNTSGIFASLSFEYPVSAHSSQSISWLPVGANDRQGVIIGSMFEDARVYQNDGFNELFLEVIPETGLEALSRPGVATSMVAADFNNDALIDILVATETVNIGGNIIGTQSIGFQNPDGSFLQVATPSLDFDANVYSAVAFDYDNDGDQDIYLTIDHAGFTNRLYVNDGTGHFSWLRDSVIDHLGRSLCATWNDADSDGDLDLYLVQENGPNKIFENLSDNGNHWLRVRPVGESITVNAVGAKVELYYDGSVQVRAISGGGDNFLGQNPQLAHFGLGTATSIDSLKIYWPSGAGVQTIPGSDINPLGVDREITVMESGFVSAAEVSQLPKQLKISSVFPNPFNPSTLIRYAVSKAGPASLRVLDLRGRLVKTLVSENLSAGRHEVVWYGKNNAGEAVPSGVYFLRVSSNDQSDSQKITLLK